MQTVECAVAIMVHRVTVIVIFFSFSRTCLHDYVSLGAIALECINRWMSRWPAVECRLRRD